MVNATMEMGWPCTLKSSPSLEGVYRLFSLCGWPECCQACVFFKMVMSVLLPYTVGWYLEIEGVAVITVYRPALLVLLYCNLYL